MKTIDLQVEGGGRSPVWACPGERGTGAGQRPIVDGIDGCGLPRKAGHRRVHSRCDLAA